MLYFARLRSCRVTPLSHRKEQNEIRELKAETQLQIAHQDTATILYKFLVHFIHSAVAVSDMLFSCYFM